MRGEDSVAEAVIGPGAVLGGRYRLDAALPEPEGSTDHAVPSFWRGTDAVLSRTVAIHAVPIGDPRAEALLQAARASVTVTDPHLLRVLDCDERDGVAWVVNEWADGSTLASVLHNGPLAPERAARLTREVAEALAAAHAVGIAHGRLTPEAVLLSDAGSVRLIGFAVAAALDGAATDAPGLDERGYGRPDPVQADVIDLASLLYAGLTGRWPGIAPSSLPEAPGDARGPLRPRQVRAGVPRMLDTLCERVLRREAHEHVLPIETAQEVLAALTDEVGDQLTGVLEEVEGVEVPTGPEQAGPGWTGASVVATARTEEPTTAVPVGAAGAHEATVAMPTPAVRSPEPAAADPEATQAAAVPAVTADLPEPHPDPAPLPSSYQDSAERPLFATSDRRPGDVARGSSAWLYGDAATGTLDPVVDGAGMPQRRAPGGWTWGRVGAVLGVLVVLAAVVLAFELGRGDRRVARAAAPEDPSSGASASAPLKLAEVSDFDPDGNPSTENPDEVPLATDGDPATGWTTLTYTRAALGGLKPGVGLLVDLGADHAVRAIDLRLAGKPTDLALYAAPGGASTAPERIAGLKKVDVAKGAGGTVTLRPHDALRTRYLVVWLTSLPPVGGGYRGEIDELTVRG